MKVRAFKRYLSQIDKLTEEEVKKLQNQLNQENSLKVIKSISGKVDYCPHCGGLRGLGQNYNDINVKSVKEHLTY